MSCANEYIAGTLVRMTGAFTTVSGNTPIDPTTVTGKVKQPDGVVVDLTGAVVKDSVGNYHMDFLPTQLGVHLYEWVGAGAAQVAAVTQFNVTQGTF